MKNLLLPDNFDIVWGLLVCTPGAGAGGRQKGSIPMGLPIGIKNTLSLRSKGVFYCPMGKPIGI